MLQRNGVVKHPLSELRIAVGIPVETKTVGERVGPFLIQKINRDSVDGLWYVGNPAGGTSRTAIGVPRINRKNKTKKRGIPHTLHIGYGIPLTSRCNGETARLISIDFSGQRLLFITELVSPCPICLSSKTLIDTPYGLVFVKDLKAGMPIWTSDKSGHRVSGIVEKTSRVPVPPTHQMIHLILDDGRELFISPPHPIIDGRTVGDLVVNDLYDGARVVSSERVSYGDIATYDILPSGETGFYWANGILLDSTLH